MKKLVLIGAVAVAALAGGWYYASPMLTLDGMRDAAQARDADKLSGYVDYEALRVDLKSEFRRAMMREMEGKEAEGFEALGMAIATALLDPMVDAMVSPEGMERLFERRAAEEKASGKPSLKGVAPGEDPIIERHGLDEFKVRNREDPDGALVFKRDGLGWKLSGVDLPDPSRAAE